MFYPWAFSRVCTGELSAVRDSLPTFESDAVQVLAISCDPMFSLRAFAEQDGLTFPLLSDFWPHGEVARDYGVFNEERGTPDRSTFIVDKEGVLRWAVHNADARRARPRGAGAGARPGGCLDLFRPPGPIHPSGSGDFWGRARTIWARASKDSRICGKPLPWRVRR